MIDAVIDLSHWQGLIDFNALRDAGILGVILKATQGSHGVDSTFTHKLLRAHDADLLIGAYHFADDSPPAMQAAHFLTVASGIPLLAIDIEPNPRGGSITVMGAAELVHCMHHIRPHLPKIYIGKYGPDGRGTDLPNSILSRCDLWVPKYHHASATLGAHDLPSGWTDWMLWQHTSTGRVAGYGGDVDRSRFNGTEDELKAWWES